MNPQLSNPQPATLHALLSRLGHGAAAALLFSGVFTCAHFQPGHAPQAGDVALHLHAAGGAQ